MMVVAVFVCDCAIRYRSRLCLSHSEIGLPFARRRLRLNDSKDFSRKANAHESYAEK